MNGEVDATGLRQSAGGGIAGVECLPDGRRGAKEEIEEGQSPKFLALPKD